MASLFLLFVLGFFALGFVAFLALLRKGARDKTPPNFADAPLPSPFTPSAPFNNAELLSLLQRGQKIQAIKRYREMTGVGLKEAKDAVEALETPQHLAQTNAVSHPGSDEELLTLIRSGQKIHAIKLYRDRTGVGLKEAKDAIEAIERQSG